MAVPRIELVELIDYKEIDSGKVAHLQQTLLGHDEQVSCCQPLRPVRDDLVLAAEACEPSAAFIHERDSRDYDGCVPKVPRRQYCIHDTCFAEACRCGQDDIFAGKQPLVDDRLLGMENKVI